VNATSASRLGWYARRVARMSPAEVAWRARDRVVQTAWSRRQVTRDQLLTIGPPGTNERRFSVVLPQDAAARVSQDARDAVLASADRLLRGEWEVLGVLRTDMVAPDWFRDPVTGRRSDPGRYAFRIDHRSEAQVGNVKQVWEISRLQHLTLLATAWFLTHDERYANRVADHLRCWWQENPFLSGVHWTSGIELGVRLISLAWTRRLLDGWPGAVGLFEHNGVALRQIHWHQQYLDAFPSRGSSANNHVIAEAAGQLVASCAFPWFPESSRWRIRSARRLERELIRNTFPSGIGRELASDYHCFVAGLGFLAAVEAEVVGHPLGHDTWERLCAMADSAAALVDERLQPPRQGDSDEGRALLLDAPASNSWPSLLALAETLVGRLDWWPQPPADARSSLVGSLTSAKCHIEGRPGRRPSRFADAGLTLLRTTGENEIWCRCDGGPHGYLSIAAHAHADALSVEVRHAGVDILADPGTYCYHGEQAWRAYFRSTIAHNTVELGGQSQSTEGGPFMWMRHAHARELEVIDDGDIARWTAEHDGYSSLNPPAVHRRSVLLDRASRSIDIVDEIEGGSYEVRIAFHLGPDVQAELKESCAVLNWATASTAGAAQLELPDRLRWSLHRGEMDPIVGWYSGGLGQRSPAFTLIGRGCSTPGVPLTTRLEFPEVARTQSSVDLRSAVSSRISDLLLAKASAIHHEYDELAGAGLKESAHPLPGDESCRPARLSVLRTRRIMADGSALLCTGASLRSRTSPMQSKVKASQ
jgi:heparinase II/III-like protein